ncbi:T9SS type B sorting domain-containing protein [Ilyomonas limi]|nr:gliding motility-associated C-terminal domain-containing protein [Ilyomonas limi]
MNWHISFSSRKSCTAVALFLCFLLCRHPVVAQCNGTITTYPYEEDFENLSAGWTTDGRSADWAWGTPQKHIIKSAASGIKCWITGGLTKDAYNNNERSYLQSPCFDLTALNYPYIRFKVFCDTERDWDGANLQYSPDNARTWIKIGYFGQPKDCINSGWYNCKDIYFVSEQDGWSGGDTTGGKWTTAQIKLPFTGGTNKTVMFRFYFGAGDKNNNYDGFGIDDFFMGETPDGANISFNYSCVSESTISFTADASPCLTNLQWDFGDVVSGSANQWNGEMATHTFSAPGNYLVNLTATDNNGIVLTQTNSIHIIAASVKIVTPITCAGDTAHVQAVVQGDASTYQYNWNTSPYITTPDAALPAGNFMLEVSGENTCPVQVPVTIAEPTPLLTGTAVVQPDCNKNNGSILVNVSGGTAPYRYNWQPGISNTAEADNLPEGGYTITVTDKNLCSATVNATLQPAAMARLNLGNDTTTCYGELLTLSAGDFNTYIWDDLSNKSQRKIDKAGVYYVTVTTADGCIVADTIKITNDCGDVYFPSAFTPNGDGLNDVFGPAGNITLLKKYTLRIYNRLGALIFTSKAPAQKWSGMYKNATTTGTYIYVASYEYNGVQKISKGMLVLLR